MAFGIGCDCFCGEFYTVQAFDALGNEIWIHDAFDGRQARNHKSVTGIPIGDRLYLASASRTGVDVLPVPVVYGGAQHTTVVDRLSGIATEPDRTWRLGCADSVEGVDWLRRNDELEYLASDGTTTYSTFGAVLSINDSDGYVHAYNVIAAAYVRMIGGNAQWLTPHYVRETDLMLNDVKFHRFKTNQYRYNITLGEWEFYRVVDGSCHPFGWASGGGVVGVMTHTSLPMVPGPFGGYPTRAIGRLDSDLSTFTNTSEEFFNGTWVWGADHALVIGYDNNFPVTFDYAKLTTAGPSAVSMPFNPVVAIGSVALPLQGILRCDAGTSLWSAYKLSYEPSPRIAKINLDGTWTSKLTSVDFTSFTLLGWRRHGSGMLGIGSFDYGGERYQMVKFDSSLNVEFALKYGSGVGLNDVCVDSGGRIFAIGWRHRRTESGDELW